MPIVVSLKNLVFLVKFRIVTQEEIRGSLLPFHLHHLQTQEFFLIDQYSTIPQYLSRDQTCSSV